jgi:hypothetical protein
MPRVRYPSRRHDRPPADSRAGRSRSDRGLLPPKSTTRRAPASRPYRTGHQNSAVAGPEAGVSEGGTRGGRRPGAGRPRTLSPHKIAEIARRRELGQPHALIARELGIPVGTSRRGAHLAMHPPQILRGAPPEARSKSTDSPPTPEVTSEAVSSRRRAGQRGGRTVELVFEVQS